MSLLFFVLSVSQAAVSTAAHRRTIPDIQHRIRSAYTKSALWDSDRTFTSLYSSSALRCLRKSPSWPGREIV